MFIMAINQPLRGNKKLMQAIVKKLFFILIGGAFICTSMVVNAAFANTQEITRAVQNFLYQQASRSTSANSEIAIEVFAPSAQFGACENPEPFFPSANQEAAGRVSVGVRCGKNGEQVRYVQAQISLLSRYLVPVDDIRSGTVITAAMLTSAKGDTGRMRNQPITRFEDLVGLVVRRNLRAGQPIYEQMVQAPEIIARGDTVRILAQGTGFQIEREGTAVDSGGLNDTIRIRIGNREMLEAKIIGPGRVVVTN